MKAVLVWALAAGGVVAAVDSVPPPVPDVLTGYASAYAPGVFEETVRYRLDEGV